MKIHIAIHKHNLKDFLNGTYVLFFSEGHSNEYSDYIRITAEIGELGFDDDGKTVKRVFGKTQLNG